MEIKRDRYLNKIIDRKENGMVKVITGIRRCGKSYLLFRLYKNYLLSIGIAENQIIEIALDDYAFFKLREPDKLYDFVKGKITNNERYYLFLDEVQLINGGFVDVINGFMHIEKLDIYVTGSNSKFLSTDILTEFRGRGDEIRVFPLSFSEYITTNNLSKYEAWDEYFNYGGMPALVSRKSDELKAEYLRSLFENVYIKDIKDRNDIRTDEELDILIDILSSSIGSLTNPLKLSNTFHSMGKKSISDKTIKLYIDYLIDAFMLEKAYRYDVKGKKYINTPSKYYFIDIGLRNARLNFRQQEESHIMENIIYNELRSRGFRVDVGVVECFEKNLEKKTERKSLEVDFIANKGNKKYYIQSALEIPSIEKDKQEKKSLLNINDSFKKLVIVKEDIKPRIDENGIITIGIFEFLIYENYLENLWVFRINSYKFQWVT